MSSVGGRFRNCLSSCYWRYPFVSFFTPPWIVVSNLQSAEHRCEYFVWLDEVEGKTRNVWVEVVYEERPLTQSYKKMNEFTECSSKLEEDVQLLQKTVDMIRGEITCIKNMVMGICLGLGFWALLIVMIYSQK
ncbi:hypothetical protein HN873_042954 [Arachis hypogaea]